MSFQINEILVWKKFNVTLQARSYPETFADAPIRHVWMQLEAWGNPGLSKLESALDVVLVYLVQAYTTPILVKIR